MVWAKRFLKFKALDFNGDFKVRLSTNIIISRKTLYFQRLKKKKNLVTEGLTKEMQAARSKILTNRSSNCSATNSQILFPVKKQKITYAIHLKVVIKHQLPLYVLFWNLCFLFNELFNE